MQLRFPSLAALGLLALTFSSDSAGNGVRAGLMPSGGGGISASTDFVVLGSVSQVVRTTASGGDFRLSANGRAQGPSPIVFASSFEGGAR